MTPLYLSRPGLICCAGADLDAFYDAACRGERGGVVPRVITAGGAERQFLVGRASPKADAGTRLLGLCASALETLRPAVRRAIGRWGAGRIGACVGSCDNGTEWSVPAHRAFFSGGGFPSDYSLDRQSAAPPAEFTAAFFGLRGPALAVSTACASSASALARAAELIRGGVCDAVIAGGADIASDTVLLGFSALEAVSDELTNPFSRNRKGINLGEGAAFFVLSKEALDTDAVTLSACGESADACHMTAPEPRGKGAAAAMNAALRSAALRPADIGYVNLHGTGTPLNDSAEAAAMAEVFGPEGVPASSTKPLTGHTLGAAGALELALCYAALTRPDAAIKLPLHRWDGIPDPALSAVAFVKGELFPSGKIRYCMSNSFAFGGCNVSIIIGREEPRANE
ncbi:MAG: 3-oxoacyl-ACP synthase [Treponema sp.]|jgi:3-oxoacyl-[acyl-carrier-protein] synthase-1|nr:3-oxoacyl-ACP synthase [Treponema sp.]